MGADEEMKSSEREMKKPQVFVWDLNVGSGSSAATWMTAVGCCLWGTPGGLPGGEGILVTPAE